jgi:chemotaxis protein CheD
MSAAVPLHDDGERLRVYLQPGHLHAAAAPTLVTTILGSCISVCLWDDSTGIGGLNHFMLPFHASGAGNPRFGNVAFDELLARLERLGANMRRLRAQVFGGSCMFTAMLQGQHLGHKNATIAFELLKTAGIPVLHSETGGLRGRKLIFDTSTGSATVKAV